MRDICTYLPLGGYVSEWLAHKYGTPVRFPRSSLENFMLSRLARKPPRNAQHPPHGLAIVLPDHPYKRPESYNYFGRRARATLTAHLERLFAVQLWSECATAIATPGAIRGRIEDWCARNGISHPHRDAVRQKFYRLRKAYEMQGFINCPKTAKKHQTKCKKQTPYTSTPCSEK